MAKVVPSLGVLSWYVVTGLRAGANRQPCSGIRQYRLANGHEIGAPVLAVDSLGENTASCGIFPTR
jgi:hypothetical protein